MGLSECQFRKEKKPTRKAKQQKEQKENKAGDSAQKATPKAKAKAAAKDSAILEQTGKLKALLQEITGPAMWRSVVRATEVDRRLGRVTAICKELEDAVAEIGDTDAAKKEKLVNTKTSIEDEADRVVALKDICKFIRSSTTQQMIEEVSSSGSILYQYEKCQKSLIEADGTLPDMVQMIAKKLIDVSWFLGGFWGSVRILRKSI